MVIEIVVTGIVVLGLIAMVRKERPSQSTDQSQSSSDTKTTQDVLIESDEVNVLSQTLFKKYTAGGVGFYQLQTNEICYLSEIDSERLYFWTSDTLALIFHLGMGEPHCTKWLNSRPFIKEDFEHKANEYKQPVKLEDLGNLRSYITHIAQVTEGPIRGFSNFSKTLDESRKLLNNYLEPMAYYLTDFKQKLLSEWATSKGKINRTRFRKEQSIKPISSLPHNWLEKDVTHRFGFYVKKARVEKGKVLDCVVFAPEGVIEASSHDYISLVEYRNLEKKHVFDSESFLKIHRVGEKGYGD